MTTITWTQTVIKLCDLKPWERNPKTITPSHAKRLLKNWQDLGQWQTIAVDSANVIIDGHQRLSVLKAAYGLDYEVKVLQADRELTDKERERIVIEGHAGSVGSWNWDELSSWQPADLMEYGFDADLLRDWKRDITAVGMMMGAEEVQENGFKEYDETIADGVEVCKCPTCGHEHAKKD
jgi:site-specific DNA-methyltransferase (adenine-specific)